MKKRHVLAIVLLAVCSSHLAVWMVASCSDGQSNSEHKSYTYRKPELWNKKHLTWRLAASASMPKGMSEKEFRQAIARSFKQWEPADVFTFSPSSEKAADITIGFQKPPDRKWDGHLGLMAAASYPWTRNRGHIYLDPAEKWMAKPFAILGDPVTDWLPHEIGHLLGLPHVVEQGYIMNETGPYGPPDEFDFSLLQHLYSPKTIVPTGAKNTPISTSLLGGE